MIWLAVAMGGALGAVARYALSAYYTAAQSAAFPWATLSANCIGALFIGIFYVLIIEKAALGPQWRPLIMVGFLGALTTFSSFTLEALLLWQQGQGFAACAYILMSVLGCLLLAIAGMSLMRMIL